ncbi:MAG: DUF1499 domain-containing protein [Leptospiraceae bacterium]|nr:DUF1499 domain-containing protein [Leptospiraceae bacterium]MCP5513447.1 DUF1499 domain-containing protein [Leptospiraceae bacterium]
MNSTLILLVLAILSLDCSGKRPEKYGVKNNQLLPCPPSPNCVNSQSDKEDSHYIEAEPYVLSLPEEISLLRKTIQSMPRTKEIEVSDNYLYYEFTSPIMRYVDDVELYLDDSSKLIHFRSASRLGTSDLGVNRKRIEAIRSGLRNQ